MTIIEMMNFDNSPGEYAMLQGWNNDMSLWSRAQKDAYLKWSSSSEVAPSTGYSSMTDYAGIQDADAFSRTAFKPGIAGKEGIEMQMLTRATGADTVSTVSSWNTELDMKCDTNRFMILVPVCLEMLQARIIQVQLRQQV
mgnify:CR=1 FL=1